MPRQISSNVSNTKNSMTLGIRKSTESERTEIRNIHINAFGEQEGPVIANLATDLLDDETAKPLLSLVAIENGKITGHIIFTNVKVSQTTEPVSAQILAPLAVLHNAQNKGVGSKLIKKGLRELKQSGVDLVFVLGHPDYYPRLGFKPSGTLGLEAPYHIPEKNSGAWMVQELHSGVIGRVKGKIICSEALSQPEHWRE